MTMFYYSTSDDFAKSRKEDDGIVMEKSSDAYHTLTKSLDEIFYKFNQFLTMFPMNDQEIMMEKSDKFYNQKYHFTKSTAKSMWYDRAVTRMSMDQNIPKEILFIVKCVAEKGGDYGDYITPKVYRKAIKFFKKPELGTNEAKATKKS